MMMKRTLKAAVALTTSVLAAASLGTAPAAAAGPNSFTLHLACDNGQSYEIFVNDGNTAAALADGSNVVAVLPGGRRGTAVPAYSDGGPSPGHWCRARQASRASPRSCSSHHDGAEHSEPVHPRQVADGPARAAPGRRRGPHRPWPPHPGRPPPAPGSSSPTLVGLRPGLIGSARPEAMGPAPSSSVTSSSSPGCPSGEERVDSRLSRDRFPLPAAIYRLSSRAPRSAESTGSEARPRVAHRRATFDGRSAQHRGNEWVVVRASPYIPDSSARPGPKVPSSWG